MAYALRIDPDDRMILIEFWGTVTDGDLDDSDAEMRADPTASGAFDQIIDLSAAESVAVSAQAIHRLAAQAPFFASHARRAIIAPRDTAFGMARMFESLRGGKAGEIEVFRTNQEALVWLQVR